MELLTGSLFLWWYVEGWPLFLADAWLMSVIQPLFWLLVGVIGVAIIISDLQELIIPRWSVLLLTLLALAYRLVSVLVGEMQATDLWWSLVWSALLVLFFFLLWSVTRGRGFGFGDVQLAFPLGLLLGSWQRIVVGIWLAFLIGALVGLGLILVKRKRFGQVVPFAPFLLLGTALSLRWGYQLWTAYVKLIAG
jgi:prepilin signal peptidase PulO-like enzyme (type II secretory pathway)